MTDLTPLFLLLIFLTLNAVEIFGFSFATSFDFIDEEHPENGIMPDSKMILWRVRYWCLINLGFFWSKPICICAPCMASVHSLPFYVFFLFMVQFQIQWILFYPLYVLILSGLNYFIGLKTDR